jgi:hypothetical protein
MSNQYHILYYTRAGVPFVEEAQTFADELAAIRKTRQELMCDSQGNPNPPGVKNPLYIKTIAGDHAMLVDIDHFVIMTPDQIKREAPDGVSE